MIRYTTPTHEHKVKGIDLSGCDVWVSYQQGQANLNCRAEVEYDGEDSLVTVSMTQAETARFREGVVSVQINWLYPNGRRDATTRKDMEVLDNLLAKELR